MTDERIYSVRPGQETPDEPRAGLYWSEEDGPIHGPYATVHEAEDAIAEAKAEGNAS
jgi:hypothetical protein